MKKPRAFDYRSTFTLRDLQRFWNKVLIPSKSSTISCWEWIGCKNNINGYGTFWLQKSMMSAHRAAFLFTGHCLPKDLVVDHKCKNKICVNPDHLRAVTNRINSIENSVGPTAINAAKTHCIRGHELVGDNLSGPTKDGRRRRCKACLRFYYHRKKQALAQYRSALKEGDK